MGSAIHPSNSPVVLAFLGLVRDSMSELNHDEDKTSSGNERLAAAICKQHMISTYITGLTDEWFGASRVAGDMGDLAEVESIFCERYKRFVERNISIGHRVMAESPELDVNTATVARRSTEIAEKILAGAQAISDVWHAPAPRM